jgi:hypothetical protein
MPTVVLTVTQGTLSGRAFRFADRTTCLIGRAADCGISLPDDDAHQTVSRHHCLLDLNPPAARIRDFGSLNGTFVNREKIGQRRPDQDPADVDPAAFPEHDLRPGDRIQVGGTVLGFAVEGAARPTVADGTDEYVPAVGCALCGATVTAGADRPGEVLCGRCRAEPAALLHDLLSRSASPEGAPLAGVYDVVRELGRGGAGAVYLARETATGREVALKLLLPEVAAGEVARQRFLREAEITRGLDHPNIVRLYDAGYANGGFLLTLEYCRGGSLAAYQMVRNGTLPADEVIAVGRQALAGLAYAHGRGVVHRDLKPHNLFLTETGPGRMVKVGDFGLAKAFDAAGLGGLTRTGRAAGTPSFVPRQQVIDFKNAKPDVDVWALAATLYALLTGRPPRDFPPGRDPWLVVLRDDPVPIRCRNPAVPPRLAELLDAALFDRGPLAFPTCAAFGAALTAAV